MFVSPIPTEPETAADARAQRTERHLLMLDELIAIGMDLTRLVQAQAKTEVEAATRLNEPAPDFTIAAERMARMVRRSMLLSAKLAEPVKTAAAARPDRAAARKQIIRAVEDAIDRDAPESEAASLHAEFQERLDSAELADDIEARPVEDIITEIRRDLGIAAAPGARQWKRRTPKDVALLCARAATPRPAAGPFVLPMPPRGWDYDVTLFDVAGMGGVNARDAPPIRGP